MPSSPEQHWQTRTHQAFVDYYARQSLSAAAFDRSRRLRDKLLRFAPAREGPLHVADIGSNAGTQARVWAELGHRVYGVEINADLVRIAQERMAGEGLPVWFHLGSATALPFRDASMDVCIAPELLEHVPPWETCLDEFVRVLRPGGVLFLSTTNRLCPVQDEFNLPLYSWYPAPLKRRFEHLAVTSRPELANHAAYPAVNWFTPGQLRRALAERGMRGLDRFDALAADGGLRGAVARAVRLLPPLRWMGYLLTPGTTLIALKEPV
ncbi:class I SAM-dependent methyltransferase [Ectothiorhodospira mobilis]|uniref:class I SAM-dependent methyltransferase n=1 Tax=Ectothiorhodospira mobilis TaxID=195064 RepID=UPI001904B1A4|nr:class I SAM-dependent methyltransferase [Ectothiorhodospira mobilis]MBK1692155.1 hypothetical protein [Ectothiorhodospira mobilis]